MSAAECRKSLEAAIWRKLGQDAKKQDVDDLLVWADIYAVAHTADHMVSVGQS